MNFINIIRTGKKVAPYILSGLAMAGVGATGYLSAKGSQKADKEDTKAEKVKAFVPAIGVGIVTETCILVPTLIFHGRIKSACSLVKANVELNRKFKEAATAAVGASGLAAIEKQMAENKLPKDGNAEEIPVAKVTKGHVVSQPEELFYDVENNHFFRSTQADVCWAMYYTASRFYEAGDAQIKTFYGCLGIDPPSGSDGKGWIMDNDWFDYSDSHVLVINYDSDDNMKTTESGEKYRRIWFDQPPKFYEELLY